MLWFTIQRHSAAKNLNLCTPLTIATKQYVATPLIRPSTGGQLALAMSSDADAGEAAVPVTDEKEAKRGRMRENVIMEIISTEKTYVEKLSAVMDVFIVPLKGADVLSSLDIQGQVTIFPPQKKLVCNEQL